ncbi:MAG: zinc-ribbon domain-containing protein, partial [Floccifex sp.]
MKCSKCGADLAPGVAFCRECGTKVKRISFCRECGSELGDGVKFCTNCGAKVEIPEESVVEETNTESSINSEEKEDVIEAVEITESKDRFKDSTKHIEEMKNELLSKVKASDMESMGNKIQEKAMGIWASMNLFCKIATVGCGGSLILFLIALISG